MSINSLGSATQALAYIRQQNTQNQTNVQAANNFAQNLQSSFDPDHDGDTDSVNGPDSDKSNGLGQNIDFRA